MCHLFLTISRSEKCSVSFRYRIPIELIHWEMANFFMICLFCFFFHHHPHFVRPNFTVAVYLHIGLNISNECVRWWEKKEKNQIKYIYIKLIPKWLLQHHQCVVRMWMWVCVSMSMCLCLSQQVGGTQTRRRSMLYGILNKYTNLLFWLWALSFPSISTLYVPMYIYIFTALVVYKMCTNLWMPYTYIYTHRQN